MDKLKMHSVNKVDENIAKIGAMFPNCLTERKNENGEVEYAIDFDMLKQELSSVVVEGNEERYQFTWPDKKKSILLANAPIAKTLRPCREESVDFDTTENLYIEGDNLDVLKLLQETYLGKIKMIYIDPPYNTGNDFVYNDDFAEDADTYLANSGQFDAEGNRLVQNTESNGRFHTDWLNMIYPRLKLAKDLLVTDGIIFVSIDENELSNLKAILDEIYGQSMFVGVFKWNKTSKAPTLSKKIRNKYEYILCYAKQELKKLKGPASYNTMAPLFNSGNKHSRVHFESGMIECLFDDGIYPKGIYGKNDKYVELLSDLEVKNHHNVNAIDIIGRFKWSQDTVNQRYREGVTFTFKTSTFTTMYYSLSLDDDKFIAPSDVINMEECNVARNDEGYQEVYKLFDETHMFDYCKPTSLIKHLNAMIQEQDAIVLDFFSGSATTAHAVMQLNAEDGGNRKFIMVQLPEETDSKSEAYKLGYRNICEIGKERIRRAGKKIKDENPLAAQNLDTGFRVLKLDSSNMKDVYYTPADYEISMFDTLADNIKEDRTPEDLLFQVMLDLGVLLSSKIEESTIAGKKVFNVADGFLMACFDENVSDETITAVAKQKPYYFVMRDSSMASDSVATNFEQIFATYSPDTVRKVL